MIRQNSDMKAHLTHELSRYIPALFEHYVMRKTAKSALAENLESHVDTFDISVFQNPLFLFLMVETFYTV